MQVKIENGEELEKLQRFAESFPVEFELAAEEAVKKAAQTIRRNATKKAIERYDISQKVLKEYSEVSTRRIPGKGAVGFNITFFGKRIPLFKFNGVSPSSPQRLEELMPAFIDGHWRLTHPSVAAKAHQLKGNASVEIFGEVGAAFVLDVGGRVGVYARTGSKTKQGGSNVRELFGSSLPQMLGSEQVSKALETDANEAFRESILAAAEKCFNEK